MTVRSFYPALGIDLPAWPDREAPVRCFAQPDAHNHHDQSPSCSVNLNSGAYNCHGCGAHGGAYDAALATGHSPRSAMHLLITHGLAQPRTPQHTYRSRARTSAQQPDPPAPPPQRVAPPLGADESDVRLWAEMLAAHSRLTRQLAATRGWTIRVIRGLQVGFDGARITIPIRNRDGTLRGVLRYDPLGRRDPKMLAVPGTHLGLIPHPTQQTSKRIILVEGPPDMLAARSCGLPAIAVPGTNAWRPSWAQQLTRHHVTIVMDCDIPGRRAADQIATALRTADIPADIVDLWPDRHDGYDLTDRVLELSGPLSARAVAALLHPVPAISHTRTRAGSPNAQEAAR